MKKAILLVGHGSNRNEANEALLKLVEMVKERRPGSLVAHAFLQFARPDLPAALSELAGKGIEEVTVVPVFLYEGQHIREDIPQILAAEAVKRPGMRLLLASVMGIDERMAQIVWERADAVIKE